MRLKLQQILLPSLALTLFAVPGLAHHSFAAEFSLQKPIETMGTITKLDWVNPHCYLQMDVKSATGKVDHWNFEFGAPVGLKKAGMKQEWLQPGTTVTVTGYRAKDDSNLGWVSKFTFPDGRVIRITPDSKDGPNP